MAEPTKIQTQLVLICSSHLNLQISAQISPFVKLIMNTLQKNSLPFTNPTHIPSPYYPALVSSGSAYHHLMCVFVSPPSVECHSKRAGTLAVLLPTYPQCLEQGLGCSQHFMHIHWMIKWLLLFLKRTILLMVAAWIWACLLLLFHNCLHCSKFFSKTLQHLSLTSLPTNLLPMVTKLHLQYRSS